MACRVEDIPEPGEYVKYDIADVSVLVVRQRDGSIKAHRSVCLHRGHTLKEQDGRTGAPVPLPRHQRTSATAPHACRWDFPQVDGDWTLPVKVDTWGGFVFVNFDLDAAPLADHLGDLSTHFERWPLEKRYKQAHVAKVLRCNWKLAQEAFMERTTWSRTRTSRHR
jgi:phenylpropionate dioxygenase-like ring-hydroxylating dioxygenase large terminal subunit